MTPDAAPTVGQRGIDMDTCEHGCCPTAVCDAIDDCAAHDRPYTEAEIAEFYARAGAA